MWLEVVRASGAREVRKYVFIFQIKTSDLKVFSTLGSIKLCTVHERRMRYHDIIDIIARHQLQT